MRILNQLLSLSGRLGSLDEQFSRQFQAVFHNHNKALDFHVSKIQVTLFTRTQRITQLQPFWTTQQQWVKILTCSWIVGWVRRQTFGPCFAPRCAPPTRRLCSVRSTIYFLLQLMNFHTYFKTNTLLHKTLSICPIHITNQTMKCSINVGNHLWHCHKTCSQSGQPLQRALMTVPTLTDLPRHVSPVCRTTLVVRQLSRNCANWLALLIGANRISRFVIVCCWPIGVFALQYLYFGSVFIDMKMLCCDRMMYKAPCTEWTQCSRVDVGAAVSSFCWFHCLESSLVPWRGPTWSSESVLICFEQQLHKALAKEETTLLCANNQGIGNAEMCFMVCPKVVNYAFSLLGFVQQVYLFIGEEFNLIECKPWFFEGLCGVGVFVYSPLLWGLLFLFFVDLAWNGSKE